MHYFNLHESGCRFNPFVLYCILRVWAWCDKFIVEMKRNSCCTRSMEFLISTKHMVTSCSWRQNRSRKQERLLFCEATEAFVANFQKKSAVTFKHSPSPSPGGVWQICLFTTHAAACGQSTAVWRSERAAASFFQQSSSAVSKASREAASWAAWAQRASPHTSSGSNPSPETVAARWMPPEIFWEQASASGSKPALSTSKRHSSVTRRSQGWIV